MMFSSGDFTAKRTQSPAFRMEVNKITLSLNMGALWHLESKERLRKP